MNSVNWVKKNFLLASNELMFCVGNVIRRSTFTNGGNFLSSGRCSGLVHGLLYFSLRPDPPCVGILFISRFACLSLMVRN